MAQVARVYDTQSITQIWKQNQKKVTIFTCDWQCMFLSQWSKEDLNTEQFSVFTC